MKNGQFVICKATLLLFSTKRGPYTQKTLRAGTPIIFCESDESDPYTSRYYKFISPLGTGFILKNSFDIMMSETFL